MTIRIAGLVSVLVYALFYNFKPLEFADNNTSFLVILSLLFILTLIYITAYKRIKKSNLRLVFYFAIAFNLILLPLKNITSDDLYSYISWYRVSSVYKENPYYKVYRDYKSDVLYPKIATVWADKPTIYGPVSTLIGSALTKISGDSFLVNVWVFKFVFVFLNLASVYLVYLITKSAKAVYLYAWNPLILFEIAVNAHIEIIMIFFLLFSLYYLKKPIKSWGLLIVSGLTKFTTFVLTPLYILKNKKFMLLYIFIGILLFVLFYYPYWESPDIFNRLILTSNLNSTVPSIGFALLGKQISRIVFWISYAILILKEKNFLKSLFFALGLFMLFYLPQVLPWYLTTLIALGSVNKKQRVVSLISLYGFLLYFFVR